MLGPKVTVRLAFPKILLCVAAAGAGCSVTATPSSDGNDGATGGTSSAGMNAGGTPSVGGTASATGGSGGTAGAAAPTGGAAGSGMTTGGTSAGMTTGGAAGSATGGSAGIGGSSGPAGSGGAGPGGSGAGSGGATTGGSGGGGPGLYVSPNGNDSNAGTEAAPFRTLTRAHQAANAGNTIWMLPGTYAWNTTTSLSKSGTEAARIVVSGTTGNRPIIDFASQTRGSNSRGIEISGNYWHIRGIEVANAGDNCIAISGSNNVVEDVILHGCEDTGLQITVGSTQAGNDDYGADNLVLNCDSYENFDVATGGENADGFAAKLRIGPGNVFRGCRAWNNADDGWDLFASNDVVVIDNCWAFSNGKVNGRNPAGDGNGFKLGGTPNGTDQGGAVHQVTHNAAFENRACGFTRNNNPQMLTASDCKVRDNPGGDYCAMSCSPQSGETMTSDQAKAARRNADGSLPPIQ